MKVYRGRGHRQMNEGKKIHLTRESRATPPHGTRFGGRVPDRRVDGWVVGLAWLSVGAAFCSSVLGCTDL